MLRSEDFKQIWILVARIMADDSLYTPPQEYTPTPESSDTEEPQPNDVEAESCSSEEDDKNTIVIVLAGKSGAGKSTIFKKLVKEETDIKMSAKPITEVEDDKVVKRNDVTIKLIDTVGGSKIDEQIRHKFHLLLYCIHVGPGSKFQDANPRIMDNLHDVYGEEIWKHCVVLFTFSNLAWDRFERTENSVAKYKAYIEEFSEEFEKVLHTLEVKGIKTESIFRRLEAETQPARGDLTPQADEAEARQQLDKNKIPTLPAGDLVENNKILPGMDIPEGLNWTDVIFDEMVRKCNEEKRTLLLKYRFGTKMTKLLKRVSTIGVGGAGGGVAIAVGTAVGTAAGVPLGPAGMLVGGVLGAGVGTVGGLAVSGAVAGTLAIKGKIQEKRKKTKST